MLMHEGPGLGESLTSGLQMRVPQRPGMDHIRPHLESDRHISCARRRCKARGVLKQRFSRPDLNQGWWQALEIRVKRRDTWVLSVHVGGQVGIRQFVEVASMN